MEYRIEMPDLEECIICYEETVQFMSFTCKHKVCSACFPKLHQCPLCQIEIHREIDVVPEIERKCETLKLCFSMIFIMTFCVWCLHITRTI